MVTQSRINKLLELTGHYDKDERYMAANDLCNEFSRDLKLDENMERRICTAILKLLDDPSNDVQSVAVKCLGVLLKKVQEPQILEIADKLSTLILNGRSELRDIYSIGVKTLIKDMPDDVNLQVVTLLTERLLSGCGSSPSSSTSGKGKEVVNKEDVQRECLDNLTDLLKRFGLRVVTLHHSIMQTVSRLLSSSVAIIRKRVGHCLGALAKVSSDALVTSFVEMMLSELEGKNNTDNDIVKGVDKKVLVQTVGSISRVIGHRLGNHLNRLIPLFISICGVDNIDDEEQQSDEMNDLRERCLPSLESFVLRCPREVSPFIPSILETSLTFITYDPNYNYDEEEEENDEDEDDYEDDYDEDFGGSDDDDSSWKVRKAAVNVLRALIASRTDRESVLLLFDKCNETLINCFRDREPSVRLDIIQCLTALINACGGTTTTPSATSGSSNKSNLSLDEITILREKLSPYVPNIIKATLKQLKISNNNNNASDMKTKSASFALIKSLTTILSGGLTDYLDSLIRVISESITGKGHQMQRLDSLNALQSILINHDPTVIQPHLHLLLSSDASSAIVTTINDDWYRVIGAALNVVSSLCNVIRPIESVTSGGGTSGQNDPDEIAMDIEDDVNDAPDASTAVSFNNTFFNTTDAKRMVTSLFEAVNARFLAVDIDQEIKEISIFAIGQIIYYFSDYLQESNAVQPVLDGFRKRLDNEATRVVTLRALSVVVSSPLVSTDSIIMKNSTILDDFGQVVATYMRQHSRTLQTSTVDCLSSMVKSVSFSSITPSTVSTILEESCFLYSSSDLQMSHNVINLNRLILKQYIVNSENKEYHSSISTVIANTIQSKLVDLIASSVTSVAWETSVCGYFNDIITHSLGSGSRAESVISLLYDKCVGNGVKDTSNIGNRTSIGNIARCISTICLNNLETSEIIKQLENFTNILATAANSGSDTTMSVQSSFVLSLLTIGEIGVYIDVCANIKGKIIDYIVKCFYNSSEDIKSAAAYSLGKCAVGSIGKILPVLLESMNSSNSELGMDVDTNSEQVQQQIMSRQKYLRLAALKELIVTSGNIMHSKSTTKTTTATTASNNASLLLQHCDSILASLVHEKGAEESVRNMVSECLGSLLLAYPEKLIDLLVDMCNDDTCTTKPATGNEAGFSGSRWIAASSARFAVSQSLIVDSLATHKISILITELMKYINPEVEASVDVRKNIISMLTVGLHHNADILLPILLPVDTSAHSNSNSKGYGSMTPTRTTKASASPSAQSTAATTTSIGVSWIDRDQAYMNHITSSLDVFKRYVVDLGPFKKTFDDALMLRKSTLSFILWFLEHLPMVLNPEYLISRMVNIDTENKPKHPNLLSDSDEISLQSHEILRKLCKTFPAVVLGRLEELEKPLATLLNKLPKENAGPESERAWSNIRSVCRSVVTINNLDSNIQSISQQWHSFYERICSNEKIGPMMSEVISDNKGSSSLYE